MSKPHSFFALLQLSLFSGCMLLLNPLQAEQVSIHDPVLAKEKGQYFLYSTGPGITFYQSSDLKSWRLGGRVFEGEPA